MTGEQMIERARTALTLLHAELSDGADREALGFVLANWHKFEPMRVDHAYERIQNAELAGVCYNLLGLKKPDEVRSWIVQARAELMDARRKLGVDPGTGR